MPGTLDHIIKTVTREVINPTIALMIALGILIFTWGIFRFVSNAEDPEELDRAKRQIIWSLLGFVIMILVFGIINLIRETITPGP